MKKKVGIAFVRVDILSNWRFWNEFQRTNDFEGAGKRIIAIANALLAEDYEADEVAAQLLIESKEFQDKRKKAGQKGGNAKAANARARKSNEYGNDQLPTLDAENGNASDDRKAPPSSEHFADADIREDSENIATPQGALLESGTSAETLNGSARPSCGSAAKNRRRLPPPTAESVYEFANQASLDTADAREWYEINFVDRPGCDKDGIVIENWKGHCKNFCKAAANKRKKAG